IATIVKWRWKNYQDRLLADYSNKNNVEYIPAQAKALGRTDNGIQHFDAAFEFIDVDEVASTVLTACCL
ncbi:MAG TPA: hypothetical protein PLC74_08705, partial [Acetobacteraceae bacterium]|nr:hypothetical protein [Acetobacteraceae bacterium]